MKKSTCSSMRQRLKYERALAHFLELVYHQKRLRSALGHRPPAEFDQQLWQSTSA